MAAWDEDRKAKAIEMYLEREPTPGNSMEIVAEVAEDMGESVNGVRAILSKAGVYVKKEAATASSGESKTTKSTSTRVSKEAAQAQLIAAIEAADKPVDAEIISKLTGKAAVYLASLF